MKIHPCPLCGHTQTVMHCEICDGLFEAGDVAYVWPTWSGDMILRGAAGHLHFVTCLDCRDATAGESGMKWYLNDALRH